jgi:formamidopyrimidine-DNA glycosylase
MWLNAEPAEFNARLRGGTIEEVVGDGKFLFIHVAPREVLVLGDMGGRLLFHEVGAPLPRKHHMLMSFLDGASLSLLIQMWGLVNIVAREDLPGHQQSAYRGVSPLDGRYSFAHLSDLLEKRQDYARKPIKAFLVHEGNIAGIGNGMLHDILFRAKIHPRKRVSDLSRRDRRNLCEAIRTVMLQAAQSGGRDTERDLFGDPGGYRPLLDRRSVGKPCPRCGTVLEKIALLGGSCYVCPNCQKE